MGYLCHFLIGSPKPTFVLFVCQGLEEGFWPWATTTREGYPCINNESKLSPKDPSKAEFLRVQRDLEKGKERFLPSFGRDLLPGMYCMPNYAVPKPNSTNYHLINDQSCEKFSLNSMVQHDRVMGYPLDNMVHFGEVLMNLEKKEPGKPRVAWKSDIVEAYRILPMHPLWQIKQINTIDGECVVDQCNSFRGSSSEATFISFNSLVAWIV